jgi:hypothetical protein
VIATPQQLEEISLRRAGKLPETPFSALLLAQAVHRRTAVFEVSRKQVAKKIVFEHGVPIECRSNLVHETLGRYMVSMGKLPEADLLPYLNQSASRGLPLGEILLEHEVVGAEELFKLLQQNLAKKLLDIFTWRDGEFRLLSDARESDSPLHIRVPQLIVTGITRYAPAAEVEAGVVPLVGKKLALHPRPRFSLDEIRLTPIQTQVAMALRSGWRIDELALGTAMPFDELNRLLYALAVLGVVVTADSLPNRATGPMPVLVPPPAAPAAAPAPPSAPTARTAPAIPAAATSPAVASAPRVPSAPAAAPAPAADLSVPSAPDPAAAPKPSKHAPVTQPIHAVAPLHPASDAGEEPNLSAERRNQIVQAYLSYRRQDSFDLLGLSEDATLAAVENAYLDFSRRFAPWTFTGPQAESIEEKARALFLAGARAFVELVDNEQRHTLLQRRRTLRAERRGRGKSGAFGIKTDLLDSEAQFKKGQSLMEVGRYREAILQLEFAADCDPQNGPYAAELAYCRFLQSPTASVQALAELQETLRRDADCGIALFYSGEIHRHLGHKAEAEAFLRRAIKTMSPDRRPIQALKALSTEKKR